MKGLADYWPASNSRMHSALQISTFVSFRSTLATRIILVPGQWVTKLLQKM